MKDFRDIILDIGLIVKQQLLLIYPFNMNLYASLLKARLLSIGFAPSRIAAKSSERSILCAFQELFLHFIKVSRAHVLSCTLRALTPHNKIQLLKSIEYIVNIFASFSGLWWAKIKNSLIVYFSIIILTLLSAYSVKAASTDEDKTEWMQDDIEGLKKRYSSSSLEVPNTLDSAMQQGSTTLDLTKSNWVATTQQVEAHKAVKFDWSTSGATAVKNQKYKVLYRIDPRFTKPQIFIKIFNSKTNKYEAIDYPDFRIKDPTKDYPSLALKLMPDYVTYFTFKDDKTKILVEPGDVLNITLMDPDDFFIKDTAPDQLDKNLDQSPISLSMIYTESVLKNQLIYASAKAVCNAISASRNDICQTTPTILIKDSTSDKRALVGKPLAQSVLDIMKPESCDEGKNEIIDSGPVCYYDQGRGMKILVNNTPIKREKDSFVYSAELDKYFLYYKSNIKGYLDFTTDWKISQDMFVTNASTLMEDWGSPATIAELQGKFSSQDLGASYLHFGRYIMQVEVGNSEARELTVQQHKDIQVKYVIVGNGKAAPTDTTSGTLIGQSAAFDANESGNLWLKVENPNPQVSGIIQVNYASYTGSTWFSDIIYSKAVEPIISTFRKYTKTFYTNLTLDSSVKRIGKLALLLYVCIYAITFLAGAVQITAKDLLIRVFKITLIVILLGKDSWEFFNTYLFSAFTDGTYYIAKNVIGVTSNNANIFGFIDPIFARYTNWAFWRLLFIELIQIHNGFTIIALMVIYSLTLYFRAILEVIVSYVIAYVGVSVMISLAPLFFILLLFEKTKSIFDNWISTLFNYVIQPSILLIFFLLIDQIISEQLLKTVVRAEWGTLIKIAIGLDLHYLGIPLEFPSLTLPFLPGIPFFIPQPAPLNNIEAFRNPTGTFLVVFSSALLFYSFCLMSKGLVKYVTVVAGQLTNVAPAMKEGARQQPETPTTSIVSDIDKVIRSVKDVAFAPARIFKNKVIDQNYKAPEPQGKKKEYTGKIFASRYDRDTQDPE
ncbi:type IV secretion system protein [Candidatus Tisiphia endosymbiont of Beris chalybata]|uniref:type IV secretion system protein n=1 Tax=Candidatus Tisiphia endosymbiont of Beris chalybata TaxID=3066262 RepID=UPI00312C70E7